ncbi:MAG: hypothetical protein M3P93_17215 [Actinomycetota bacterium]|jgi:hypothetical protein|nr:hypothetical protein [Actinomycetota bacterium]
MADETQGSGRERGPFGGSIRSAVDELLERTTVVVDTLRRTGSGALGATPLPGAVTGLLGSLRQVVEQAPAPTVQLDLFLQEVKAKRALVRALREQLDSFDAQLATLEASLAPLQVWGRQWERVRSTVLGAPRLDEHE